MLDKKTRLRLVFSTHFLVFGYLMKPLLVFDTLHPQSMVKYIPTRTHSYQPYIYSGITSYLKSTQVDEMDLFLQSFLLKIVSFLFLT